MSCDGMISEWSDVARVLDLALKMWTWLLVENGS